jgi:ABC-type transport system involved in multi-copper enzyme maturation permease subunit
VTDAAVQSRGSLLRPVMLVARAVVVETVRRREFYVLAIFMGIFLLGAVVANIVGVENPATGTFILDLGLSLCLVFSQLVTLLTAARQIPDELEARTLHPLLAKPVSRGQCLVGKWLASIFVGVFALALLLVMGWVPAPKMERYHDLTLLQALLLQVAAFPVIAALALLTSLFVPKMLNIVLLAGIVFKGSTVIGLLQSRALGTPLEGPVRWVTGYVPDFSHFNLIHAYTGGLEPVAAEALILRLLYAGVLSVAYLAAAIWLFNRRAV